MQMTVSLTRRYSCNFFILTAKNGSITGSFVAYEQCSCIGTLFFFMNPVSYQDIEFQELACKSFLPLIYFAQ